MKKEELIKIIREDYFWEGQEDFAPELSHEIVACLKKTEFDPELFMEVLAVNPKYVNLGCVPSKVIKSDNFDVYTFFANPNVVDVASGLSSWDKDKLTTFRNDYDKYSQMPEIKDFVKTHYGEDQFDNIKEFLDAKIHEIELKEAKEKWSPKRIPTGYKPEEPHRAPDSDDRPRGNGPSVRYAHARHTSGFQM
jgi:hypothetical protein